MVARRTPTFPVGSLVNVLGGEEPILGVVMDTRVPLGYYEYQVLDLEMGNLIHTTRLRLESSDDLIYADVINRSRDHSFFIRSLQNPTLKMSRITRHVNTTQTAIMSA